MHWFSVYNLLTTKEMQHALALPLLLQRNPVYSLWDKRCALFKPYSVGASFWKNKFVFFIEYHQIIKSKHVFKYSNKHWFQPNTDEHIHALKLDRGMGSRFAHSRIKFILTLRPFQILFLDYHNEQGSLIINNKKTFADKRWQRKLSGGW